MGRVPTSSRRVRLPSHGLVGLPQEVEDRGSVLRVRLDQRFFEKGDGGRMIVGLDQSARSINGRGHVGLITAGGPSEEEGKR